VNAFHLCGGLLAGWAVLVAILGITRENFPGSGAAARIVGAISVVLVVLAIGTAIYTSANEEEDEAEPAGFVRPV
jgi:hypothetical protein